MEQRLAEASTLVVSWLPGTVPALHAFLLPLEAGTRMLAAGGTLSWVSLAPL